MSLHRALQRLLLRRGEAAWCAGVGRSCCRRWASARQAPADQDDDGAASTSGRCEEQQHQQQQAPPHLATRLLLRDFIHNSLYHPVSAASGCCGAVAAVGQGWGAGGGCRRQLQAHARAWRRAGQGLLQQAAAARGPPGHALQLLEAVLRSRVEAEGGRQVRGAAGGWPRPARAARTGPMQPRGRTGVPSRLVCKQSRARHAASSATGSALGPVGNARHAPAALPPQTSFLTPAELFSPWYGYILARHIMEHRKHTLGLVGAEQARAESTAAVPAARGTCMHRHFGSAPRCVRAVAVGWLHGPCCGCVAARPRRAKGLDRSDHAAALPECSCGYPLAAQDGLPLHIIEVGGGNGTLARDVLVRRAGHGPCMVAGRIGQRVWAGSNGSVACHGLARECQAATPAALGTHCSPACLRRPPPPCPAAQDWLRDNRPDDYARTSYMCLEISATLAAQQYEAVVVKGGHGGKCVRLWARACV